VRSARPHPTVRLGLLAVCCLLLAGALAGCTTTQETAAAKQAESRRILNAREEKHRQHTHANADGPKSQAGVDVSAHRQEENSK
jgi:hypothetical protein